MKILAVHNYYQQRGGEDQCFEDEIEVLRLHGHTVIPHITHNDSINATSKLEVAAGTLWSYKEYSRIERVILAEKPDVLHAVNTFPLFSPSIFYAARKRRVPVVFEVANYRLSCSGTYLLRDGKICEACHHSSIPIPAIIHRCYRGSLAGSATVASSIVLHRLMRTWHRVVDLFMCPSITCRTKLIEGGLPADKIIVKPNVLNFDPGVGDGPEPFVVFVGRLSPEKGLSTILAAWREDSSLPPIKIIGVGPLSSQIIAARSADPRIELLGKLPIEELVDIVGRATCLVMPSIWYEPFGRTTIEAFAKGTPVVGSCIGGTAEIIDDGITGWLFTPGDSKDLAAKIRTAMNLPSDKMLIMRKAAREVFLNKYTAANNYRMLMSAYQGVIAK